MGDKAERSVAAVIAGGVLTIVCALFAGAGLVVNHDLSRHGKVTSARVLETRSGRNSHVIVEFTTAAGQRVRATVTDVDEKPGTIIRVRYLPDDPKSIQKVGSHSDAVWIGGAAVMAVLMAALTVGLATGRLGVHGGRVTRASRYGG